jgi:hypothetical protein
MTAMAVLEKFPEVSESAYPRLGRVRSAPLGIDSRGLDRRNGKLAERLRSLESFGEELRGSLRALVSSVDDVELTASDLDRIDEWVDRLGESTRSVAGDLRRNHPKIEREIARARTLAEGEPGWTTHADLLERFVDELFDVQEALDTARTRLLVLLSKAEPGHGPIFENPDDLKNYLESLLES